MCRGRQGASIALGILQAVFVFVGGDVGWQVRIGHHLFKIDVTIKPVNYATQHFLTLTSFSHTFWIVGHFTDCFLYCCRTFAYIAPEILTGQRCTAKVDIFSLGTVLWEVVTGEQPSRGRNRAIRYVCVCCCVRACVVRLA